MIPAMQGRTKVAWAVCCGLVAALTVAVGVSAWNLPEDSWLAWREYEAGNITYEQALEWYLICKVGVTTAAALVPGLGGGVALFLCRPRG